MNEIPAPQSTQASAAADKARARPTGDAAAAASATTTGAGQPTDRSTDSHSTTRIDRTGPASGKPSAQAGFDRYLASFSPPPETNRSGDNRSAAPTSQATTSGDTWPTPLLQPEKQTGRVGAAVGEVKHAEMSSQNAPTSFPGDTDKTVDTGGKAPAPASVDQHPADARSSSPADHSGGNRHAGSTDMSGPAHRADQSAQVSSQDAPTSFPGDTDQPPSDLDKYLNSPEQRSAQAGGSAILDALGVVPVVSTVTGVAAAGYDLIHAATDSDRAGEHLEEAALDALGAIPIVGQVLSAEALVWDASAAHARQAGVSNADAPTFSHAWVKGVDGFISDIVNPDSLHPQPPPNQTGQ